MSRTRRHQQQILKKLTDIVRTEDRGKVFNEQKKAKREL